ncbi:MAG: hypothetical protein HN350_19165 [Phycisphaerales bacterium]|jgi:methyl-accepting chemotaxis protein|nr:hypothetical protein [Phycisphaerales bacterium]
MNYKIKRWDSSVVAVLISSVLTGGLSVWQIRQGGQVAVQEFESLLEARLANDKVEMEQFETKLMADRKQYLTSQVQTAMSALEQAYKDAHDTEKIQDVYREQLHNAVNTAYSVIQAVNAEKGLTTEQKQAKAAALVKQLRYGPEGKDYFWINDLHPKMVMHPFKPELDGQDLSNSADPNGKKLFVEMAKICTKSGDGFVDYAWPKYGANEPQPKLSYVKLFKPWGWVIGSGVYMEVAADKLKQTAADTIGALRYGPEGKDYFWINDLHPKMVMHPYKPQLNGKDLSDSADPNGKKLFVEMAKVCKKDGQGFVEYAWPKYGSDKAEPKISYVKLFEKWGWVIGTGVYVDDLQVALAARQAEMDKQTQAARDQIIEAKDNVGKNIQATIIWLAGITVAALFAVVIAAYIVTQRSVVRPITRIINGLKAGAEQTASVSGEVSASSQSLAQGASEQAASIEETTASIEEMSSMTKQNAINANEAKSLAGSATAAAEKGSEAMERMSSAIDDIKQSSDETAKIIKTIDEIAFQTNLLALNAAVEAARAGEAGKGFAVVAEEVRNLAHRSADAAKNTTDMIEHSTNNADRGVAISKEVGESLSGIADGTGKVNTLVGEISAASEEQARGIEQINTSVNQMDTVAQSSAAMAEESAAASEELSAQAEQTKKIVRELAALVGGARATTDTTEEFQADADHQQSPHTRQTQPHHAESNAQQTADTTF